MSHPLPNALCAALLLATCGCQRATQRIDREQTRIDSLARQTIEELTQSINHIDEASAFIAIDSEAQAHLTRSLDHQHAAIANQQAIAAAAGRTRSRLVHVEDKVHPMVRIAQTWGSAALIAAIIALLAYLGVGPLIRRGFQALGLLIPKPVRTDAKFDAESITAGTAGPTQRERIAARRAADRVYDRAFSRAKART